jgi:hypothetical protein
MVEAQNCHAASVVAICENDFREISHSLAERYFYSGLIFG